MAHKQTAINPRSVVSEALKCRELGAEREQRIEGKKSRLIFLFLIKPFNKREGSFSVFLLFYKL